MLYLKKMVSLQKNVSFINYIQLNFVLATHHLNKTIEVTRVNLFNIATQYKAIFNDDEHSPLASVKSQNVNQNVIFFCWINDKVKPTLFTSNKTQISAF